VRHVTEPERRVPVIEETDVLVVGGGPAGLCAAVAAARRGVRTALVERYGFLGGMATAGLVGPFAGARHRYGDGRIIGGIPWEIVERLVSHGGAMLDTFEYSGMADGIDEAPAVSRPGGNRGDVPFDSEVLKWVADRIAGEAGVRLHCHTLAAGVVREGPRVAAVVVERKSGRAALVGQVVVDATGDADVAAMAGAPFEAGRPNDGAMQPMTLMFRLGGVDTATLGDITRPVIVPAIRAKAEALAASGELPMFGGPWTFWGSTIRTGEVMVNMVRLWGDATDTETLTRNAITGRDHVQKFVAFLRGNFAEFRGAYLIDTAAQVGIRETRRIRGEYVLSDRDIAEGRQFTDSIALGGHVIDIHSPAGTHGQVRRPVAAYQIPYRCLLPLGVENLLVAGRPISTTHKAHGSARVMGTAMATGQAAGVAAAIAARGTGRVRDVDVGELRRQIAALGGLVDAGVRE
jgi:hypothetical protein